ncbi:hypothetical protein FUA26_04495 [Seonamhaeicola algicola]|uniref:Uncharacterized protein n=1 Tax=Seonamhaeicola algicola TaxID=1719036 RepID=A0A5C7AZX9_9FLAO|nr:hypothetical protein [Seonamhaeicola algicola]TXE13059.1 hypothetical protein FUA26_04495 [Seonamhaeicola algicola]
MNIIEKYDKPFQYGALALNLVMAYQFFMLWYQPTPNDIEKISSYITLMLFEFVLVHSGIFMAVMPKKLSLFIFVPFYGIFALAFNSFSKDNTILILYCFVILNRMRFAFSNVPLQIKARVIFNAISSMGIYFVLIFVVLILQSSIPFLGLTPAFLNETNFLKNIDATGEFIEKPHVTMCFGFLYYIGLSLVEVYFLRKKPPEKTIKKFETLKNIKSYKVFKNKERIR